MTDLTAQPLKLIAIIMSSKILSTNDIVDISSIKNLLTGITSADPSIISHGPMLFDKELRINGKDIPSNALTMVGLKRLDNLEECILSIIKDGINGDFIEAGVWRGGCIIFMALLLKRLNVENRIVYGADSFMGMPEPSKSCFQDEGDLQHTIKKLVATRVEVEKNIAEFGVENLIMLLEGWFKNTLPKINAEQQFSLIRLDGDMYESTMIALENLYPKLNVGGYYVVDDYGAIFACKTAVDNFRKIHCIKEEIMWVDWTGIYWRRQH